MRFIRLALTFVLGTTLAVTGPSLSAQAIGGLSPLAVSPSHGQAGSTFSLTYAISPCQSAAGLTIGFSWGALPTVGQVLGTALTDANCRATLTSRPPVNAATHQPPAPGNYQVFGYLALPTGGATPNTEVSASYTIDVAPTQSAPTPTPKASATATNRATTAATPTHSSASTPGASAYSGPTASAVAQSPPSTGPSLAGNPLVLHATKLGPWTLEWQTAVGGVGGLLLLAGLTLFAIAAIRRRRARAAVAHDKAA